MIRQCAILFGCLALGELIVYLTGIKLPPASSVCCCSPFLKLGWIKLHWVQGLSDFLVANLGFFLFRPEWRLCYTSMLLRQNSGR